MMRALGPAVGFLVAALPELAVAQADGAALGMTLESTWPAGTMAMSGTLPAAEILAEVRREGFYPVGRAVQRGRVYVLFAVDQDDMDVKLTVDAASGRVLGVTGAVVRFGGPEHYGYRSIWRERPPAPPVDVPTPGWARSNAGAAGTRHATLKRFPPLPRTRPADLAGDRAPPAQSESQAVAVQPAAAPPVTVAPVVPLE
jgi:hypothetical protein